MSVPPPPSQVSKGPPPKDLHHQNDPSGPQYDVSVKQKVAVVLVGHGSSASSLLSAAKEILSTGGLDDVIAIDAGVGESQYLNERMHEVFSSIQAEQEILLISDLLGASPCMCGQRLAQGHHCTVLTGLNLAILLKLAVLLNPADERQTVPCARELAEACAESAMKSICVEERGQPQ